MGHAMVSGGARASVPVTGIKLGDIAVGQLVKINENGSPVEFYVAKHDYESALNGAGRTLLVRKDLYKLDVIAYNYEYANGVMDAFYNGTYKASLDILVQTIIGKTTFYYTNSNLTLTTINRSVFQLSAEELGDSTYAKNKEGSPLPIYSVLRIAYYNGSTNYQWTRTLTPNKNFCDVMGTGQSNYFGGGSGNMGWRPCFTLPSGALFDDETMLFNGKVVP